MSPRLPRASLLAAAVFLAGCASTAGIAPQSTPREAASLQMGFAVFTTPVYAGAVEHHVYRQLAPRPRRNGRLV